jgi:NTE family protein
MFTRTKTIGLALSGGAARGAAHLGVLRVLEREKIPIDVVAGVSAGSIVGALYCAGVPLPDMLRALQDFRWSQITSLTVPIQGLVSFAKLEKYLIKWIGDVWFSELKLPFAVGTTDLLTGRAVTFITGRVAPLVRASCSIPGLVVPLQYGSYWLGDGGVSCNLPSHAARELGADVVIGVDLIKPYVRRNFGALGIASTALEILVRHSGGGVQSADIVIAPALDNKTYSRFSRYREMVELGEQATEQMLPVLRARVFENSGARLTREKTPAHVVGGD